LKTGDVAIGLPRPVRKVRMGSFARTQALIFSRLYARRAEIELAIQTRVGGISDPDEVDPTYAEGLKTAVAVALDYGLAAIETGVERIPPVPDELLTQARLAARRGVSLDTVLRRYFAGYTLLSDFLVQEIEQGDPSEVAALQTLMRSPAAVLDRLVTAITEEYTRVARDAGASAKERQAERVRRLLAGELIDTSELRYDFDCWHLGMLVEGDGAADAVRGMTEATGLRLLFVEDGEGPAWAWLGGRGRVDSEEIGQHFLRVNTKELVVSLGEPGRGIAGWRLTHRQAIAAWPVAQRGAATIVRYGDVALLASIMQDEVLASSLRAMYLDPLADGREGGRALRETLRAYFATERNVSSAGAMLGVSRRTVANRLRAVETRIGRPLTVALTEIDVALRLDGFADAADSVGKQ
jgi:PucR-like helix-turn-helix protein/diguanylate cyclase with GGDEF domain